MLVDMDVFIHRSATCDGWYLRLVVVAFHRRQGVDGRGGRCRLPSWSLEWLSSCVIDIDLLLLSRRWRFDVSVGAAK
jgi:hypothetical protein